MEDAGLSYEVNNEGADIFKTTDRKPKFDYIIVKDASRYSRSLELGMSTINRLRDKDVVVIFENAGVKSDDSNASFVLPLLFTIAENESQNMSNRIKFSKKHNVKNGKYMPSRLPFGYMKDEENEIVIHEEQAEVVRRIFEEFLVDGAYVISKRLNQEGILTQMGHEWTNNKITRIVKNKIYTGTATVNRTKKKNVTDTKRYDIPEEDWIEIPNATPEIVTVEEWENANNALKNRINKNTKRGRKPAINDIYYKKLYCPSCGNRYVRHKGRQNEISYVCDTRRKGAGCRNKGISITVINRALESIEYYDVIQQEKHSRKQIAVFNTMLESLSGLRNSIVKIKHDLEVERIEKVQELNQITEKVIEGTLNETIIRMLNEKANTIQESVNKIDKTLLGLTTDKIDSFFKRLSEYSLRVAMTDESKNVYDLLDRAYIYENEVKFQFKIFAFFELIDEFNELAFNTDFVIDKDKYANSDGIIEITITRQKYA